MSLRFHEISEARHHILNPLTDDQLMLLADICQVEPSMELLDLACGKGELLSRWSAYSGLTGVGVDISPVFIAAAEERARDLAVDDRVSFVLSDARDYQIAPKSFDIVSCLGATWIGGGLQGTLEMMRPALRDERSLLLVGEPFWNEPPTAEVRQATDGDYDEFTSLAGKLERFEQSGFELVEMVISSHQGWDRYMAKQWLTVSDWLRDNPDDPDAPALAGWYAQERQLYLAHLRRYLGWGVFVLRQR
jgi:SAM-dependent methyltransferase